MSAVSSLIRSIGNGGEHSGFIAMLISFIGLSSAATRFEDIAPHLRQRWTIAHSPFFLTQTAMGSMIPPQSEALSSGSISTCRLERRSSNGFCGCCPLPAALQCVRTPCKQKLRCRRGSYNNLFRTVCVCFRDSFFLPKIELREDGRVCFICRPPGQRTLSDDFVINFKQNLLVFLFKKRSNDRYLVCVFRSARHYRRQSERE